MTQPLEATEVLDAEHRPLAVIEPEEPQGGNLALFGTTDPVAVIANATRVADALKAMIVKKGLVAQISGKEYPQVEAWQTLAIMLGLAAVCEWSRPVEGGWEARVVVQRNGLTIAAAEAQCLRSEKSKRGWEDYAIRSMAQTRATSKSLRSVLGFVMVLAGYEATPAEEMPGDAKAPASSSSAAPPPTHDADEDTPANRERWRKQIAIGCKNRGITRAQRQEIAEAFTGQYTMAEDPTQADPPNNSARLTAAQLHLLYKLLARMVSERNRQGEAFSFDAWLAEARKKWSAA